MSSVAIDDILDFWFGPLDENGCADSTHAGRWWKKDAEFDEEIRRRFAGVHQAIRARELDDWLADPRGRLAQIIVLDQFSRNLNRGKPAAFASDARALELALEGLDRGVDRELPRDQRSFFYMPLVHSEKLAMQDRAVALFTELRDSAPAERRERNSEHLKFAEMHRDIIKRFGRFPHRNAIIGRTCTGAEVAFLEEPGSGF